MMSDALYGIGTFLWLTSAVITYSLVSRREETLAKRLKGSILVKISGSNMQRDLLAVGQLLGLTWVLLSLPFRFLETANAMLYFGTENRNIIEASLAITQFGVVLLSPLIGLNYLSRKYRKQK